MVVPKQNQSSHPRFKRLTTEMAIMEQPKEWLVSYQEWVEDYNRSGEYDWAKYVRPRNALAPSGPPIVLSQSRLLLVSGAGAYLKDAQPPFDMAEPFGDYTIRAFSADVLLERLAFPCQYLDPQCHGADPKVLLPLGHLHALVEAGVIGELAPTVVSFLDFQPNAIRVVKELVPAILKVAYDQGADAALLVPASSLGVLTAGLLARALEVDGIPAAFTAWNRSLVEITAPPRAAITHLKRGWALGAPEDASQQRRILEATLSLLEQPAPVPLLELDETAP